MPENVRDTLILVAVIIMIFGFYGIYVTCFSKRCDTCNVRHADWPCDPDDLKAATKHDAANRPDK